MPRVAVRLAVFVFLGRACAVAAATCNGDERFCALPFTMHTFPGASEQGAQPNGVPKRSGTTSGRWGCRRDVGALPGDWYEVQPGRRDEAEGGQFGWKMFESSCGRRP